MNKFYLILGVILIMIIGFVSWNGKVKAPTGDGQEITENNNSDNKESTMTNLTAPGILDDSKIVGKKAVIKMEKGTIEFELYADRAPKTVSNFVYLAEKGFYDGLTFHRVVPGFVAQGGDPDGNGTGNPGYQFSDEPVVGEYLAGTVAMANSGADTNGSQFFICLEDLPTLPKDYNLFGQVTSGMEVVRKIAIGDKMTSVTIVNK